MLDQSEFDDAPVDSFDFRELPTPDSCSMRHPPPQPGACRVYEALLRPDPPAGAITEYLVRASLDVAGVSVVECDAAGGRVLLERDAGATSRHHPRASTRNPSLLRL